VEEIAGKIADRLDSLQHQWPTLQSERPQRRHKGKKKTHEQIDIAPTRPKRKRRRQRDSDLKAREDRVKSKEEAANQVQQQMSSFIGSQTNPMRCFTKQNNSDTPEKARLREKLSHAQSVGTHFMQNALWTNIFQEK
jgi:hypothetical protein